MLPSPLVCSQSARTDQTTSRTFIKVCRASTSRRRSSDIMKVAFADVKLYVAMSPSMQRGAAGL